MDFFTAYLGVTAGITAYALTQRHPWRQTWEDLCYGTQVIGGTGMGKTSWWLHPKMHHWLNEMKLGVCHVEIADSGKAFLDQCPEDFDCYYIAPWRDDKCIGINLLGRSKFTPEEDHRIANSRIGIFKNVFRSSWGDKLEGILLNSMLMVMEATRSRKIQVTLFDVQRFLTDEDYRKDVRSKVHNQALVRWYTTWNPEDSSTDSVMQKLTRLLAHPACIRLFSQKDGKVTLDEMLDSGKYICFDLDCDNLDPFTSPALARMATAVLETTIMGRKPHVSQRFILVLDEFQRFAMQSLDVIITQARKYCCATILLHQHSGQLGDIDKAVENCQNRTFFAINIRDARGACEFLGEKKREFNWVAVNTGISKFVEGCFGRQTKDTYHSKEDKWEPQDLLSLPKFHCVYRQKEQGYLKPAKHVKLPKPPKRLGHYETIAQRSIDNYGSEVPIEKAPQHSKDTIIIGGDLPC